MRDHSALNLEESLPEDIMLLAKSTRQQEVIRRWILLLPLATAVMGAVVVHAGLEDEYGVYLPALFFIGALIVTASMLHQRRMLDVMVSLAERLHTAYARIDSLHHLAVDLNQPMNTVRAGETVLEYSLQSLTAAEGALWLRYDFMPVGVNRTGDASPLDGAAAANAYQRRWYRVATQGLETSAGQQLTATWEKVLERGEGLHEMQQCRTGGSPTSSLLSEVIGEQEAALSLPVLWQDECIAVVFIHSQSQGWRREDIAFLRDVALGAGPAMQNALLYQSAAERAEIDGLTKLYNHRAIQERLTQEIARLQRVVYQGAKGQCAVAMMDLTDFKLFNDAYGHAVGDQVLRHVSECLRRTFRTSDVVGRYGGDEFVALLPDTDYAGAETLCARIIETLRAGVQTAADGSPINIRLACGVAAFPGDGENVTELLEAADKRLYLAKSRGELLLTQHSVPLLPKGAPLPFANLAQPDWSTIGLMESIILAIDQKDHYTKQHSEKVWRYTQLIARELQLAASLQEATQLCSLLFDVGKIVLPHAVLRKPGRLSAEENYILQQHPVFGAMMVKDVPHLDLVLGGVRHHHEAFDGTGYPDKLRGEDIPLLARMIAVADSFDAMTAERPYRPQLSEAQALAEIKQKRGTQFDPTVVDAFLRAYAAQDVTPVFKPDSVSNGVAGTKVSA